MSSHALYSHKARARVLFKPIRARVILAIYYKAVYYELFYSWFHGKITRDQAEQVMSCATDGQFLIKESMTFPGDYVLFVW